MKSDAEKLREFLTTQKEEWWEDVKIEQVISIANKLLNVCEYIIEHELYHGVNQGISSEDAARQALASAVEIIGEK